MIVVDEILSQQLHETVMEMEYQTYLIQIQIIILILQVQMSLMIIQTHSVIVLMILLVVYVVDFDEVEVTLCLLIGLHQLLVQILHCLGTLFQMGCEQMNDSHIFLLLHDFKQCVEMCLVVCLVFILRLLLLMYLDQPVDFKVLDENQGLGLLLIILEYILLQH